MHGNKFMLNLKNYLNEEKIFFLHYLSTSVVYCNQRVYKGIVFQIANVEDR